MILILLLAFVSGASAQSSLPSDGFYPGWKASGPPRIFIEQDLFNHIDGGAELYLEFGFARLRVQSYVNEESELAAELYEMTSPLGALGIYLMNAGRETPWEDVPARNSSEDAQVVALKGRFLLKISNFGTNALRPAMAALARMALAAVSDEPFADPFAVLPASRRVAGSERLIAGPVGLQPFYTFGEGDILKLGDNPSAVLAEYESRDGSRFTRMIAAYSSPEAAAAVLADLRANHDPYMALIPGDDPDGFVFSDYQKKYGRIQRREARLEFVFKAASPDWD